MIGDEDAARGWLRQMPECDEVAMERLTTLVRLLAEENKQQNLISASSLAQVWSRHIVDSAQLLNFVPRGTEPWLDLGTGAGFPGIVIGALRPDCRITLVESRARRIDWLDRICRVLDLNSVQIVGSRLEQMEKSDFAAVISARAFAPLPRLLDLAERFSTADTLWLLPKGRSAEQELDELRGWNHLFHVEQSVTDSHSGVIVGKLVGRKGKRK